MIWGKKKHFGRNIIVSYCTSYPTQGLIIFCYENEGFGQKKLYLCLFGHL